MKGKPRPQVGIPPRRLWPRAEFGATLSRLLPSQEEKQGCPLLFPNSWGQLCQGQLGWKLTSLNSGSLNPLGGEGGQLGWVRGDRVFRTQAWDAWVLRDRTGTGSLI